jgi:DNA-binding transcriptional ArsR family regulator
MKPDTNNRLRAAADRRRRAARQRVPAPAVASADAGWTFLTNHSHVLLCLVDDPDATVEALARRVGVTERSARRIIGDLETAGYLARERVGRRNRYRFDPDQPLRHPVERHRTVRALLDLIEGESP